MSVLPGVAKKLPDKIASAMRGKVFNFPYTRIIHKFYQKFSLLLCGTIFWSAVTMLPLPKAQASLRTP
jgi:hypothetical protein